MNRSPTPAARLLLTGLAWLVALPTLAADWPQFRGTNRDGQSNESAWFEAWPENTQPKVAWRAEVGKAWTVHYSHASLASPILPGGPAVRARARLQTLHGVLGLEESE